MSTWQLFLILVICVLTEGYFTGTELAVIHADKIKLRTKAKKGSKTAKLALEFLENPGWFFTATLLGTNLALVTASVCTTYYIVGRFGESHEGWALLLSPIVLIFGEIIPKSFYQHFANRLIDKIVYPIKIFGFIFAPAVILLSKLNDLFLSKISAQYKKSPIITRAELEHLIDERKITAPGEKPLVQHTLISKIFDLAEKKVSNIMKPMIEVEAIPISATRKEALDAFERSAHSRLPVYQKKIVNIIGVLNNFDVLMSDRKKGVAELMHPAYYVPEEMLADDLLITMKRKGEPMAIVVDEFGGASGLVTLEDVFEEIVGEIQDEFERPTPLYFRIGKNRFIVQGRLEIYKANERLKLDIPKGDYETIAGFLIHQLGKIPPSGTQFIYGPLQFIVQKATDRAILEVEIRVTQAT